MTVQQGVELIEQHCVSRQILLKQGLVAVIASPGRRQSHPVNDSPGVAVNYERRLTCSIDNDVVGGFLPDAVDGQKFGSERCNILGQKPVQTSVGST